MHDHPYVSETPGVCGGYPVVRGTRIPVRILVAVYRESGGVEQILAMYPHLSPEQVQGALDYYATFPARVDEDFARHAHALAELQNGRWPG
jgi:uncharacterized protein (DUF433 family)